MGDKPKDEKGTIKTSITELSTANFTEITRGYIPTKIGTFDNYMDELFGQGVDSNGKQIVGNVSSPVRNFANADSVCRTPGSSGERAIWQDSVVSPNPETAGYRREHGEKIECLSWLSSGKVRQTTESMCLDTESKTTLEKGLIGETSSATDFGKYMKVKDTSSFEMQPQSSDFDFTVNMVHFNTSNATERAQQVGLVKDVSAHYNLQANEQFFDHGTQFAGSLPPVSQIKADPGNLPSLAGEEIVNIDVTDYAQPSTQTLAMLKHEPCRIPVSTTGTDSALWCQTGLSEDQHQDTRSRSPCRASSTSTTYNAYLGVLPQRLCFICGDEASGCHYGVLTCGSCKVFFKRAVEGHQKYLCAGRNDCIVDKIRRKNCPACRLRKCYQAGMMLGGRKLKKFGALKAVGLTEALSVQPQAGRSCDPQVLSSLACVPTVRELRFYPQIVSILENIEPEVVYSGYDSSQPDLPHVLLNSLNRLCERQLLWIVKWSKSLPGFRNLHINDQMSLIQYSWMGLMLLGLGWRSFQNVSQEYLYFAPDLVLHEDRMKQSPISHLCLAMQYVPQEFANLQITKEEFLCMKALMLLSTVPLEGLKSQEQFDTMRQSYIQELSRAIHMKEKGLVGSSQRFYHLTKLMDAMHEIAKKVNLYCLSTFVQAEAMRVEFPEMMSEVVATQLPKMLAGMVKPLLFHTK